MLRIYPVGMGVLLLVACNRYDPQADVEQWNAQFVVQKQACEAGSALACQAACKMATENTVCPAVQAKLDMSKPENQAWVADCTKSTAAQGAAVCAAAGTASMQTPSPITGPAPGVLSEAPPNVNLSYVTSLPPIIVGDAISEEALRGIVEPHFPKLNECYLRRLGALPTLAGELTIKMALRNTGEILTIVRTNSTVNDAQLEQCVIAVFKQIPFPPQQRNMVMFNYRLKFSPAPTPLNQAQSPEQAQGHLPKEVIKRIISRSRNRVEACYELARGNNPALAGKVTVKLVIDPSGRVSSVATESDTMSGSSVPDCIQTVFRSMTFPAPQGGPVNVTYPFVFKTE
jgi:hypothetical protein